MARIAFRPGVIGCIGPRKSEPPRHLGKIERDADHVEPGIPRIVAEPVTPGQIALCRGHALHAAHRALRRDRIRAPDDSDPTPGTDYCPGTARKKRDRGAVGSPCQSTQLTTS